MSEKPQMSFEQFLRVLQKKETGNLPRGGEFAVGDNGDAIGPLQIHECNYDDAIDWLVNCSGDRVSIFNHSYGYYLCCNYWTFSCMICWLYMRRYSRKQMERMSKEDIIVMARRWNGGPTGDRKKATLGYANEFVAIAKKIGLWDD